MNLRTIALLSVLPAAAACSSNPHTRMVGAVDAAATGGARQEANASPEALAGCWVELFEGEAFTQGKLHAKIQGPTSLPTLEKVSDSDWRNRISSIIVGPDAQVVLYDDDHFRGDKLVIGPGQRVSSLEEYDLENSALSMEVNLVHRRVPATAVVVPAVVNPAGTWVDLTLRDGGVTPVRVYGSAEIRYLTNVGGRDLRNRIIRIESGPDARVVVFGESNFGGRSLTVGPGQRVEDLTPFGLTGD